MALTGPLQCLRPFRPHSGRSGATKRKNTQAYSSREIDGPGHRQFLHVVACTTPVGL